MAAPPQFNNFWDADAWLDSHEGKVLFARVNIDNGKGKVLQVDRYYVPNAIPTKGNKR